jgi:hypothetical protein
MNIPELRRIAKRYGCSVETHTHHGIQTIFIRDSSYGLKNSMSRVQVAEMTEAKFIPLLKKWGYKNVANFWTGASEVRE